MHLLTLCITTIINHTSKELDKYDLETLTHAKTRCVYYYPKSPCLKKFIKKDYHKYWAVCGKNSS